MENMKMIVKGDILHIEVDLSAKGTPSKTGKTIVIATSRGSAKIPGREERVGLNVFRPR